MGTFASGIISSVITDPKQVHIDFEDCILAGHSLFGTRMDPKPEGTTGQISYTTKGKVWAYVQFKQPVPQGLERLALWPAELYDQIAPPKNPQHNPIAK
jgi:hypothetical protein